MKTYNQFHGQTPISEIGRELRKILISEKKAFKILTGYGSTSGTSQSKHAALKSLKNMRKMGLILGYLPGEVKNQLLSETSPYYETKLKFNTVLKNDADFGNDGIIFVFVA